jgi:hypothetical protein
MTSSSRPVAGDLWDGSLDGSATAKNAADAGPRAWRVVVVGTTVLWLLAAIEAFSDAGLNLIVLGLLFGFGMLLAMAWLFWTFCLERRYVRHGSWIEVIQWAFVSLAGLLGIVLLMTDLDLQLRLRLSEPALRRCVADLSAQTTGTNITEGRRVGLFRFEGFERRDGCILMRSAAALPEGGLLYCPAGRPPQWTAEYSFRQVRGPWWLYENNF